eukprot:6172831-Pleurochrysis_carterae.AAC.1
MPPPSANAKCTQREEGRVRGWLAGRSSSEAVSAHAQTHSRAGAAPLPPPPRRERACMLRTSGTMASTGAVVVKVVPVRACGCSRLHSAPFVANPNSPLSAAKSGGAGS